MKYAAVVVCRNDNYGGTLNTRATYCLNSLVETFDEVIYVDWNSPEEPLTIALEDKIQKTGRLRTLVVTEEQAKQLVADPSIPVCETVGKNMGIRRTTAEYIIATNIDIVVAQRAHLDKLNLQKDVFYTSPRYEVPIHVVQSINPQEVDQVQHRLMLLNRTFFRMKVYHKPEDSDFGVLDGQWSKVCNCGDFQLAHRDIWLNENVRGFEESMIYRMYLDSNVQKKAWLAGNSIEALEDFHAFHLSHSRPGGGEAKQNDLHRDFLDFQETNNSNSWGAVDMDFEEFVI